MTPVNHRRCLVLFLLFSVSPLLLAQEQLEYPSANLSTLWVNNPSQIPHTVEFEDGSQVRSILLRRSPLFYGLTYACGFYCNAACNGFLFSVFAVYVDSVDSIDSVGIIMGNAHPQVVWSANRATPVGANATLHLTDLGDLVLAHANGTVVWSTGTASRSVAGMNISLSGNLVLFDQSGAPVWQSFEHPTDTLVLGQTLKEGQKLDANVSITNWSKGPVYLTVLSDGLYAFIASTPPQYYYQHTVDGNKSAKTPSYVKYTNGSLDLFTLFATPGTPDKTISLPPASSSVQFMRLEYDGHLRVYEWTWIQGWQVTADVLALDVCAYPMVCGEYGICSNGQCSCPAGESGSSSYFKPIDDRRINLGCSLVTPLSCQSMQDHQLLTVDDVSYFSFKISGAAAFEKIDEASCKQTCLNNCSCKAALFQYSESVSDGYCFLPTQLFSLQNNQPSLTYFNSSAYIKVETCINCSKPAIRKQTKENKGSSRVRFIVGIIVAIVVIILGGLLLVYVRRRKTTEVEEDDFPIVPGMPTRFSFQHLEEATNNFCKKLGQGGFGSVFEGSIGDQKVAVKCLDGVGQGKREFLAEVETIGSIHHINLVKLIGFCADKFNRLLVYEYMSNGSLDNWIYSKDQTHILDWQTLCKIITDIAKGLSYIHEECRQRIAHLDIKPQNILLDDKFNAKLSDFGLAKLIDRDQEQVMTRMRGTRGYLAPEWLTSVITEKVDVYSFGVVIVEIVCGRKNLDYSQPEESIHLISLLQETLKMNRLEEIVSRNDNMKLHVEEAIKMIKLAVWCLQNDSSKRPSMSTVVKVLQGAATIETDLDYDIVTTAHLMRKEQDNYLLYASSTPSASLLSGPR
ncbi:G-type lectin S-receptor-like serine/threonine-protein kinase SD2-5 [Curcuma longa]|uniref:G-type lectin S-receptor-like serine/threonine-protein kinase SD2-5 n=1 Tax=Curcuma longa TaxID=136217 RepID=UPI003D9DDDF7